MDEKLLEIRKLVLNKCELHKIPCLALGIVHGENIYEIAVGYRDVDRKLPVTPRTNFCIASITKSFTSLTVLKLQEKGLLSIEDPVTKYLPELELSADVKILHFLSHTSGIPALCYAEKQIEDTIIGEPAPFTHPDNVLPLLTVGEKVRVAKPGEKYLYLNEGYVAVGKIVEKVTGKSFREVVKESILNPLGMYKTYFETEKFYEDPDHADPMILRRGKLVKTPLPSGIEADGGLLSNVEDMLRYVTMLINRGKFNGVEIVSERSLRECLERPIVRLPYSIGDEDYYCLGIALTKFGDITMFHHSGSILVHTSHMAYIPDRKLGIVVLMSGSSYPPIMITLHIISKLLNINIRPVVMDNVLDKLVGTYVSLSRIYRIRIVRRGACLVMLSKLGRETVLVPEEVKHDYARFFTLTADFRKIYAEFVINGEEIELRYERYVFRKVGA